MYIGPWQEFRLGKVLKNVATDQVALHNARHGRRAGSSVGGSDVGDSSDNKYAGWQKQAGAEFQALLSKLSELYGEQEAVKLLGWAPGESPGGTSELGGSDYGGAGSAHSAPTPRGTRGTPSLIFADGPN